eukprot:c25237_g1_i1 orf=399-1541(+)
MASLQAIARLSFFFFLFVNTLSAAAAAVISSRHDDDVPAIFVFGDSLSDTGNAAFLKGLSNSSGGYHITEQPYGETFPGWPTGRYSDGRVIIDFLASYLDLPFLNAFLNSSADFEGGVNYAVGGATALNTSFLQSLDIYPSTNLSLDIQVSWHLSYKEKVESFNGFLPGSPSLDDFNNGLYVLEIGGNDYMNAFVQNYSPSFVNSTLIPLVLERLKNNTEVLLNNGAKRFLFISLTPFGCSPFLLTLLDGSKDNDGCLQDYNLVASSHGEMVQDMLTRLRLIYPHATFSFMDYFGAYSHVVKNNDKFGFTKDLKACCGAGDSYPYNFNFYDVCNPKSASICVNPKNHFIWDGVHPTESMSLCAFDLAFNITSFGESHHNL